ncbi:MAG: hypothetical protein KA249_07820, partial [Dermatophilaceae bacterium]|nr:hypothetical protein [Dermatophilaceae bacterium]
TVLHPVLGVESGVISNVFYEDADPTFAGLLRVIAEFGIGSLPDQRLTGAVAQSDPDADGEAAAKATNEGSFRFRADGRFAYEEYLSGNDNVQAQRNLAFAIRLRGIVRPQSTFSFQFEDELRRETRPTNYESRGALDRDINRLVLQGNFQPRGRTLSGHLRFQNTLDIFESDEHSFANRMQNTLGARLNWQWFPATRIYGDASLGFFGGLGDSTKVGSMPLRLLVGAQTVLTVNTTLNTRVGFGKGFYASGPDFTNVVFGAQFGYRFSPQGRMTVLYDYDFADSINANFYRDHAFGVQLAQQIDRWTLSLGGELRLRAYRGVLAEVGGAAMDRSDLILSFPLNASYNFSDRLAGSIDYRFVTDQTDFRYMSDGVTDDPSYTRHELLVGIRGAL